MKPMMKTRIAAIAGLCLLSACSTQMPPDTQARRDTGAGRPAENKRESANTSQGRSAALTVDGYKRDLARRISEMSASSVYSERPQALLRSVIVIKYVVADDGRLLRADFLRSNHDRAAEASAMQSLRNAAPFPKPLPHLPTNGKIEIMETWLFNDDGRFQLRTVALPQKGDE
jgi:protein TonB